MTIKIAVVYHSGYGHTKKLAESVAKGVKKAGAEEFLIHVDEIKDYDPEEAHWQTLSKADAIIFGAPIYMGSLSAQFKAFMDKTSKIWFTDGWADKVAGGFVNAGSRSGGKGLALAQLVDFAASQGMIWVSLGLKPGHNATGTTEDTLNRHGFFSGVGSQSDIDAPPDIAPSAADLRTGEYYGERVAKITAQFKAGKKA